ncbi:MAG: hypothetical protein ACFE95_02775 [Candidatus Hodarchaeota archaeon]
MILNLVIFGILASLSNSFGDALKFSGIVETYWSDFVWHVNKYGLNYPTMLFTGYYLGKYIETKGYKHFLDIFHLKKEHFVLLGVIILNGIVWQVNYNLALLYIPEIF